MSRYDADWTAAGEAQIEASELLGALGGEASQGTGRFMAMAKCLSGESGWREAATALGGTFGGFCAVTGLRGQKEE